MLDICIVSGMHADYKKYFDKCVEMVEKNTTSPYKLYTLVTNTGSFAQNYNKLIKQGKGEYVVLLSDDVLVFKNWDKALLKATDDKTGVTGLCSNCDYGDYHGYVYPFQYNGTRNIEDLNIEEVSEWAESLWGNGYKEIDVGFPPFNKPKLKFYMVMIPRKVIESVGLLNESYKNCFEDDDYSNRVKEAGLKLMYSLDSYCWHFIETSIRHNQEEHNKNFEESKKLYFSIDKHN